MEMEGKAVVLDDKVGLEKDDKRSMTANFMVRQLRSQIVYISFNLWKKE